MLKISKQKFHKFVKKKCTKIGKNVKIRNKYYTKNLVTYLTLIKSITQR